MGVSSEVTEVQESSINLDLQMDKPSEPVGYKQTEVGTIPEDWDCSRIGALGSNHAPAVKAGPFGSSLTKDQYVSDGFKVYGQEQVIRGDYLYGDYFISAKKFRELESCAVRPGDILLSLVGTIGKLLEIPKGAPPGVINPRLLRISLDRQQVLPRFFKYLFESAQVQARLERQAQGGTMGVLNAGVLRPFSIPLPPLFEQHAIATALSDMDALLDSLDRLIAKKRDLKQAAMQQLLTGQTRLPGFEGEWEVKRLGELLSYEQPTEYLVSSSDYCDSNDLPVLTAGKTFILGFTGESHGIYTKLPVIIFDDFTTASRYVTFRFKAKSSAMKLLTPQNTSDNCRLLYEIMQQIDLQISEHKRHWISEYQKLEVRFPGSEEQTAIVSALSDMDNEISVLELRQKKTSALKQAMMQELLTGRTRLITTIASSESAE